MKISRIRLEDFKIYKDINEIVFDTKNSKNISLVSGKNGFGKTTFLTSLIWGFYGNLMSKVEEKYRKDIKNSGGYDNFLNTLVNKNTLEEFETKKSKKDTICVEIHLVDVLIPSIPCENVVVRRSYNFRTKTESLKILIDGQENELTKEVGYEVFINDFILPREIAKFFFFDAEKIVSLAEAKTKNELRTLSKAYSEVLGIKKYEDLKLSLNTLITKLRRSGVSQLEKGKLDKLIEQEQQFDDLLALNNDKTKDLELEHSSLKIRIDHIQEKLIREGNEITVEELKELKEERDDLRKRNQEAKVALKKLLDIIPLVISGNKFQILINQIELEFELNNSGLNNTTLINELGKFSIELKNEIEKINLDKDINLKLDKAIQAILSKKSNTKVSNKKNILLDLSEESSRNILATYSYIKDSFSIQFKNIVKEEKNLRQDLNRVLKRIKQAEARKENPLAQKLREDKLGLGLKIDSILKEKENLLEERIELKLKRGSNQKVLSEYEKNFNLLTSDKEKYNVSLKLLEKINVLTNRIKEAKKYSLEKSILLGLKKLMHKSNFIINVNVRIENDVMDIDLLDSNNQIIDKDSLSKGEQQLYATALLKALVDESGINFPIFIDSPLQKFDKDHSSNVIQQFYPSISEQVVLFPLLQKELSSLEYEQLKPNLNGVYLIDNDHLGSTINRCSIDKLFDKFKEQNYVFSH